MTESEKQAFDAMREGIEKALEYLAHSGQFSRSSAKSALNAALTQAKEVTAQGVKHCAQCQTPNSCGSDGKCLEQYIKVRIAQGTDDIRDRLVAISSAVADSDDRAAQSMLRETLSMLSAQQPAPAQRLTDLEIASYAPCGLSQWHIDFARAIETALAAKLGITLEQKHD